MHDYQPLDLTQFCNVGTAFISGGSATFDWQPDVAWPTVHRGQRRRLTRRAASSALASREDASVTIPVGAAARYVIFAHALLESRVLEGESIGHVVANYLFRFSDGQVEHVPIRERFEVALVPTWWGGLPFLAVPDNKNGLMPRYEGKWGEMGERQSETFHGTAHSFYLWAWENRDPTG